jgi:nitronate monooxygenase
LWTGRAVDAGAAAVQLGTLLLRSPESGARPVHKDALASGRFTRTGVTVAFSGKAARGLENRFMAEHAAAPACYPELHRLTSPLRAAAAAAGDPEAVSLWAGTGFRQAVEEPAGDIAGRFLAALA